MEDEEDIELFDFNVKYTRDEYLKLNKFHIYVLYRYIHILVYFIIFTLLSVYLYTNMNIKNIVILCIGFVLYTAIVIALPYVNMRINKKKMVIDLEVHFKIFSKAIQTIVNNNVEMKSYDKLLKAYETRTNFYIYISNNSAYIIPKKKITGKISMLRSILKHSLGKKYVNMI